MDKVVGVVGARGVFQSEANEDLALGASQSADGLQLLWEREALVSIHGLREVAQDVEICGAPPGVEDHASVRGGGRGVVAELEEGAAGKARGGPEGGLAAPRRVVLEGELARLEERGTAGDAAELAEE